MAFAIPPSEPYGLLAHTALRSIVSSSRLIRRIKSLVCFHIEKPFTSEEFIWNFLIAPSSSERPSFVLSFYDCSKSSSHKTIECTKCIVGYTLKVVVLILVSAFLSQHQVTYHKLG